MVHALLVKEGRRNEKRRGVLKKARNGIRNYETFFFLPFLMLFFLGTGPKIITFWRALWVPKKIGVTPFLISASVSFYVLLNYFMLTYSDISLISVSRLINNWLRDDHYTMIKAIYQTHKRFSYTTRIQFWGPDELCPQKWLFWIILHISNYLQKGTVMIHFRSYRNT